MKKLSIMLFSALSVACATGYNPVYSFYEIQVVNLSTASITNVNLSVNGSDKSLNCDSVARNAHCQVHFGKRRYPQQGIELSWTHGDGSSKSRQLMPSVAAYFSTAAPLVLIVEINQDGSTEVLFRQETSIRG